MKSAMKAAAMMLMATVMTVGMASCVNDDDDNSTHGATKKITGAETTITITPSTDSKEIAETILEYTDESGRTQTQTAMGSLLTARVKVSKLPANIDITVKQVSLSGAYIVRDQYNLGAQVKTSTTGYNGGLPSSHTVSQQAFSLKNYTRNEVPEFFKKTHIIKKTLTIQTTGDGTNFTAKLI